MAHRNCSPEWKQSRAIFLPKLGKPLNIDHLRPIWTSCLGRVYERITTNHLNNHMDDRNTFLDSMIGFRWPLSAQEAFIQIKKAVLDHQIPGENIILTDT